MRAAQEIRVSPVSQEVVIAKTGITENRYAILTSLTCWFHKLLLSV